MKKLASALTKAAELDAEFTGKPLSVEFRKNMQILGAGIFRLVVMGEIKKGKSSFINALLGHPELVPTSSNIATSTIFKIRYGQSVAYKVYFTEQSGKTELSVRAEDLYRFGTEDGNPDNEQQVDFIEVTCPSPILKAGLVMIDTPGLGGTFRKHKKITYQYVPKADAVFFVTDSVESPIGALEIEYLKDIRSITKHIYFVQTKINAVDTDAADARKANNLGILRRNFGLGDVPYFMLDSEIRHMADDEENNLDLLQMSGYPELLSFVNNKLLPAKRVILSQKAVIALAPILQHLVEKVREKEQLLNADTEDERNKVQKGIHEAQEKLDKWNTEEKTKLLRNIFRALDDSIRDVTGMLSKCRPAGEIQVEIEDRLAKATSVDGLLKILDEINQLLSEYASKCMQGAASELQNRTERILMEQLGSVCSLDTSISTEIPSVDKCLISGRLGAFLEEMRNKDENFFDTARNVVMGGTIGMSIASAVGSVLGSVVPVVGTIIGSAAGTCIASLWGGYHMMKSRDELEFRAMRNHASSILTSTISGMYSNMVSSFERVKANIKNEVQDKLEAAMGQRTHDLQAAVEELRGRSKMSSEMLVKRKQKLEAVKQQIAVIHRVIAEYLPQPQKGCKS